MVFLYPQGGILRGGYIGIYRRWLIGYPYNGYLNIWLQAWNYLYGHVNRLSFIFSLYLKFFNLMVINNMRAWVVYTGGNLPRRHWHRRQICRQYRWHRWQICHRCQQHQRNMWQNFPPVSLIPVANLPPVSLIPAANVVDTGGKFATGVVDNGGAPWLANIPENFQKNSKQSQWDAQGLGGNWSMKKTSSKKSCDTVPLRCSPKACPYPSTSSHCSHTKQYFLWNCQILRSNKQLYRLWCCPTASSHTPSPLPTGHIGNTSCEKSGPVKFCSFIGKLNSQIDIDWYIINLAVRHVTGNDQDYLRKIPRVVVQKSALL